MFRLVIIDDDDEIRNSMKVVIPWEEHGIEICGEARNGLEALEVINTLKPDILLVDIRMPKMDGLELLEELNKRESPCRTIILSSYDEFSYAKKTMSLGVRDYLLKPCRPEEIIKAVKSVIHEIEEDLSIKNKMVNLYNQSIKNKHILKEKAFRQMLIGEINAKEELLQIKLKELYVVVIKSDQLQSLLGEEEHLINFCIGNVALEIIGEVCPVEMFTYNESIVLLCYIEPYKYEQVLKTKLHQLQDFLKNKLDISCSMGISSYVACEKDVVVAYHQSVQGISIAYHKGGFLINDYSEKTEEKIDIYEYLMNEQIELIASIFNHSIEEVLYHYKKYLSRLNTYVPSIDVFFQCHEILFMAIYQGCLKRNIILNETAKEEIIGGLQNATFILKKDTIEKVQSMLLMIYKQIHQNQYNNTTINNCVNYIHEHFEEEITLDKVADYANISSGYLSQLFKQVMKIKFIDYVNKIRIENSCTLLMDHSLKTYEIAPMIGYKTERYYSKKFKQYMGMTPSEYRKQL